MLLREMADVGQMMLRKLSILAAVTVVSALVVYWWLTMVPVEVSNLPTSTYTADLASGKTTFDIGGCSSCHAVPKQDDRTKLGGGLALASPFGIFYAPNISPDPIDGIGRWTEAEFVAAVRDGASPRGEHYFPAFPFAAYHQAKISDIRDLFAYLKTLPPVSGKVRDHDVPFPFNVRRNIGIWKMLFMPDEPFKPDAARSAQWNRGAYLVNTLGHCAECHSPRNFLGGIVAAQRFAGGPAPEGKGWVPNITQKGLADWSEKDIAYFLETGTLPDGDSVGGSMVNVIRNTSQLSDDDRMAIATYVKSLPAVEGPPKPARAKPKS